MPRFTVTRDSLGAQELVVLTDTVAHREVRIARHGATVLSIKLDGHDIADGFRDEAELVPHKGSRFAIMTPFANRVEDSRYTFEGQAYDLQPGVVGKDRASRHGFLRGERFDVRDETGGDDAAKVTFATQAIRPEARPGYPFALDFAVTFTLDGKGLTVDARTRNVGDRDAPTFFGWHPYFRLSDTPIEGWVLQIPADEIIVADEGFIPVPGPTAWQPIGEADASLDFRQARAIGHTELNNTYAKLARDADGRARTYLSDPATGRRIAVWQEKGVMLAFTSDTAERDARKSVALEPMECIPNAFNREDCRDAITLSPGAERRFVCGVEFGG
ncbi:aldose epimerase [Luteibacter aegosomatis]|uniref:aldose 1-epimerase n=1 Tax=Luteibacter aegosomatis TaxID=2911537 RepID=UPI001FF85268|nr:aldose epimerase [Luteibacter aegosomatis]UPG85542.1 aldose epimerase [Luteibacter aegosomatis]